ncbi:MAG: GntR family transcriptional regulator [Oleispira sp.]|nr:GntR family transcriptional regulator [Oleispira sp.]
MSVKTLPDQITDLLIALVFVGKLLPGDKLPPERQLAEHLGVDRTSLRMALKTLTRMNVINTIQGSGIRVLDYKLSGGLDFLANLYQIDELELGGELLLAGLEMFNRAIPSAIKMSVEKSAEDSQGEVLSILHKMHQGIEQDVDVRELARLEVQLVDNLLSSTGNIFMQLAGSSSRQIRIALTEKSYELIDVKKHLDWLVNMMMRIASGMLAMDDMVREYNQYINEITEPLKQYLMTLPKTPKLLASPLHNDKNIMDLDDIMKKNTTAEILHITSRAS